MDELVDRIVASVGVDRPVAEKAVGIILDFLVTEGPADKVGDLMKAKALEGILAKQITRPGELIELASSFYTLYPGDIFLSGTPAGVGQVVAGDLMEADIEGVARLIIHVQ